MVLIVRPHCPPDPNGLKYEQYCRQKLMLYKPFRCETELLSGHDTFAEAYAEYLQTEDIPPCLEDDIHRFQQTQHQQEDHREKDSRGSHTDSGGVSVVCGRHTEDWMFLSQLFPHLGCSEEGAVQVHWCAAATAYPNLEESPSFIARSKERFEATSTQAFTTYFSHGKLQLLHNGLQKLDVRGGFTAYNRFPSGQKQLFSSQSVERQPLILR